MSFFSLFVYANQSTAFFWQELHHTSQQLFRSDLLSVVAACGLVCHVRVCVSTCLFSYIFITGSQKILSLNSGLFVCSVK